MKKLFLAILFVASVASSALAQVSVGVVTGRVVSRVGREPIEQATVTLHGTPTQTVTTSADGTFTFTDIPFGFATIEVNALGYLAASINVKVDMEFKDLNYISLSPDMAQTSDFLLDDSNFTEFDSEMENDSQSTPVSLSASKDVFNSIAGYKFGSLRFRTRGYDQNTEIIYLNGVEMTDANTGNGTWSLWSGLNEATRNQEDTYATSVGTSGVGGINGTTNILARAS